MHMKRISFEICLQTRRKEALANYPCCRLGNERPDKLLLSRKLSAIAVNCHQATPLKKRSLPADATCQNIPSQRPHDTAFQMQSQIFETRTYQKNLGPKLLYGNFGDTSLAPLQKKTFIESKKCNSTTSLPTVFAPAETPLVTARFT